MEQDRPRPTEVTNAAPIEPAPPWAAIPTLPWGSLGWRMGDGEEELRDWMGFMRSNWSTRTQALDYLVAQPPAPYRWRYFLLSTLRDLAEHLPSSPDDKDLFWKSLRNAAKSADSIRVLRKWSLIGDDVAYREYLRTSIEAEGLRPPWKRHGAIEPEFALRLHSREVTWWGRWLRYECTDVRAYLDAQLVPGQWVNIVAMIRRARSTGWNTYQGGAETLIPEIAIQGTLPPPWFGDHPPLPRAVSWGIPGEGAGQVIDDRDRWMWWVVVAFDDPKSWDEYLRCWPPPTEWQAVLQSPSFLEFARDWTG
jgi:hypothetical protein